MTACLFDLDGVLTRTAAVHDAAWAQTFDAFLAERAARTGGEYRPFDQDADYRAYVDGRPRADGVRAFLASRGITLPDGAPDDPPDALTVHGLGNRKNANLLRRIRRDGVAVYAGSVAYLRAARAAGLRTAVVSASANTRDVLATTGLAGLLDVVVDGVLAAERGLAGKPAPDTYLAGAGQLGAAPAAAAVFEDALAGVAAGRGGGFFVVGLNRVVGGDRQEHADELRRHGADLVVADLAELLERP